MMLTLPKTNGLTGLKELHRELHDMAQPIAALQCRLEIACILGGSEDLREAVMGGLEDVRRIVGALSRVRTTLAGIREQGTDWAGPIQGAAGRPVGFVEETR